MVGFDYTLKLSTRPSGFIGDATAWEEAVRKNNNNILLFLFQVFVIMIRVLKYVIIKLILIGKSIN